MKNFLCPKCEDTGKIGFIFKRVCPVCGGEPEKEKNKQREIVIKEMMAKGKKVSKQGKQNDN